MQIDSEAIRREQQEALARVAAAVIAAQEILAGGTLESGKRKASMQVADKPAKRARIFGLDPDIASGTDSEDDEEIALMEKVGQLAAAESSGWDSSVSDQETAHQLRQSSSSAPAAAPQKPSGLSEGSPTAALPPQGTSRPKEADAKPAAQLQAQEPPQQQASDTTTAAATEAETVLANPEFLSQQQADAVRKSVAQQSEIVTPATGLDTGAAPALAKPASRAVKSAQQAAEPVAAESAAAAAASAAVKEPSGASGQTSQVAQRSQAAAGGVPEASGITQQEAGPLDLASFARAEDLESEGMARLKGELQRHGLKCGGTVSQRAARLFLLKDKSIKEIDRKQLAKQ